MATWYADPMAKPDLPVVTTATGLERARPATRSLMTRILDTPGLVAEVQALPPRALGGLIKQVGLEDCAELVALATTEQLRRVFDDDLWQQQRPGADERFDPARFLLWLEVLLEAGEDVAVARVAELPEELLVLGLSRQLLVLGETRLLDTLSDDAAAEKALSSQLSEELGEYTLVSRAHDGWDAVLAILIALDRDHHQLLARLLERCAALTDELVDDAGGLYQVLTAAGTLEEDVAAEREERRVADGYVAPADARAFLKLAASAALPDLVERDALTRAYFRARAWAQTRTSTSTSTTATAMSAPATPSRLAALLHEVDPGASASGARALTSSPGGAFETALRSLADRDPTLHARRMEELGYLANVLVAGGTHQGRAYRPVEAAEVVLAICNRGLAELATSASPETIITQHGADALFRIGWRLTPGA